MNELDLRATAKLLLDDQLSRRDFLGQIAKAGIATAAATTLADSLAADESDTSTARGKGRTVSGITGGEAMAEFLIDWNVPYVFGLGRTD